MQIKLLKSLKRIGTSTRESLYLKSEVPGPGTYLAGPKTIFGPKYGFGLARRDRDLLHEISKTLPGPGAYDLKRDLDNHGTTLVSRKPDSALRYTSQNAPGPGAYEPKLIPKSIAPSYRIGNAHRDGLIPNSKVPGPGEYTPKLSDSAPKYRYIIP